MNYTLRTVIKKAIAQISGFAHMNLEETKDFIRVYLERQFNHREGKDMDDQNMEEVFQTIAHEQKMSVTKVKNLIYGTLTRKEANPFS